MLELQQKKEIEQFVKVLRWHMGYCPSLNRGTYFENDEFCEKVHKYLVSKYPGHFVFSNVPISRVTVAMMEALIELEFPLSNSLILYLRRCLYKSDELFHPHLDTLVPLRFK